MTSGRYLQRTDGLRYSKTRIAASIHSKCPNRGLSPQRVSRLRGFAESGGGPALPRALIVAAIRSAAWRQPFEIEPVAVRGRSQFFGNTRE